MSDLGESGMKNNSAYRMHIGRTLAHIKCRTHADAAFESYLPLDYGERSNANTAPVAARAASDATEMAMTNILSMEVSVPAMGAASKRRI